MEKEPSIEKQNFTGAELDTLVALVEHGPLPPGEEPSKTGRDSLVAAGLAARIVYKGQEGYTAATYAGGLAYRRYFGGDNIRDAKIKRISRFAKFRVEPSNLR